MPGIGDYTALIKLIIGESAKYFALLLFAVLAIRLWRRLPNTSGANRRKYLGVAAVVTAVTGAIGYFSVCHSLGLLYDYYGMSAFHAGRLRSALSLFETSSRYWNRADTLGKKGICLLFEGKPEEGARCLQQAKALRQGRSTEFERFYEGVYHFFQERHDQALPLLESSSGNITYRWDIIKLLAAIGLERNQAADSARLMKPFMEVEVKEVDQAYVVASLKLLDGKTNEVRTILEKFPQESLPDFWKPRFEKLRAGVRQ